MKRSTFALLGLIPFTAALGETPEQLSRNVNRLSVTLSLDREVYLPQEIATATITITNPTNAALVVPQPFKVTTGTIILSQRWPNGEWHSDEHFQPILYDAATPTITMAPGETKQLTFRMDTLAFSGQYPAHEWLSGMQPHPGRYRFNYMYTYSPEAAYFFNIRDGDSMDHLVDVPVPLPAMAPPGAVNWYRPVVVIRQGSEYAVCVARRGTGGRELPRKPVGKPYSSGLGLLKRIATSTVPIVSLQAELDPLQRIAVRWTDANNLSRFVTVDLDVNVVQ